MATATMTPSTARRSITKTCSKPPAIARRAEASRLLQVDQPVGLPGLGQALRGAAHLFELVAAVGDQQPGENVLMFLVAPAGLPWQVTSNLSTRMIPVLKSMTRTPFTLKRSPVSGCSQLSEKC